MHFAEFKIDYEKYKPPKASGGLQYLIHIFHQRFEDGLDLTPMTKEELDLTKVDHWNLYRFVQLLGLAVCPRFGRRTSWVMLQTPRRRSLHLRHLHGHHDGRPVLSYYALRSGPLPRSEDRRQAHV